MEKTKIAQVSAELDTMKDAARRLQEHLVTCGITLKHAQALEALTASLGAANWRTLRNKLNQPKPTAVAKAVKVWDASKPRWSVHAVYSDNNQRYSDDFFGATAMEAQINAQMDRLADEGWMTRIDVTCVVDQFTGQTADQESYVHEAELLPQTECIKWVCTLAAAQLGAPPSRGIAECEEYDRDMRAVEFWAELGSEELPQYGPGPTLTEAQKELNGLSDLYSPDLAEYGDEPTFFTDSRGVEDEIEVLDALHRVLALASKGMDLTLTSNAQDTGVFQVLQTQAFLHYFSDRIAVFLNGAEM